MWPCEGQQLKVLAVCYASAGTFLIMEDEDGDLYSFSPKRVEIEQPNSAESAEDSDAEVHILR